MLRISGSALPKVLMLLFYSGGLALAAETRVPTPEEFKEQVRQYNESGRFPGSQPARPVRAPVPLAVEQFQRAVSLHSKRNAIPSELKEAASLYQAASDAGMPQASANLALLYLEGKGVKKDAKKAVSLLNMASKKNIPQADMMLARLYLTGKDVKRDDKKGEWHLNKAAKTGDQNAVKMLAEYKEWKKKNEQAMKQYQELLKKAQIEMDKSRASSITAPQPPLPWAQFPVIPGQAYLGMNQTADPFLFSPPPPSRATHPTKLPSPWAQFPIIPGQSYLGMNQTTQPFVYTPPPPSASSGKLESKEVTVVPLPAEVKK